MIYVILILGVIGLDFLSKIFVKKNYEINKEVVIYKNLRFKHIKNNGLAFGFLNKFQKAIYLLVFLSLMLFSFLFGKVFDKNMKMQNIAYSLALAGGLGNFIDRVSNKNITDFIYFKINKSFKNIKINLPIFNIADIAILLGVVLMFISEIVLLIKYIFSKK